MQLKLLAWQYSARKLQSSPVSTAPPRHHNATHISPLSPIPAQNAINSAINNATRSKSGTPPDSGALTGIQASQPSHGAPAGKCLASGSTSSRLLDAEQNSRFVSLVEPVQLGHGDRVPRLANISCCKGWGWGGQFICLDVVDSGRLDIPVFFSRAWYCVPLLWVESSEVDARSGGLRLW